MSGNYAGSREINRACFEISLRKASVLTEMITGKHSLWYPGDIKSTRLGY